MMLGTDDERDAQQLDIAWQRLRIHLIREKQRIKDGKETDLDRFLAGRKTRD
jgi:hypothetical protein